MIAKYVLAVLAVVFAGMAAIRLLREGRRGWIAAKTWLVVAAVFGVTFCYLFVRSAGA